MNEIAPSLATQRNLLSFKRFVEARLAAQTPWGIVNPDSPLGLSLGQEWQDRLERVHGEDSTR